MATKLFEKSKEMGIEIPCLETLVDISFAYRKQDYSWFNENYNKVTEWYTSFICYCMFQYCLSSLFQFPLNSGLICYWYVFAKNRMTWVAGRESLAIQFRFNLFLCITAETKILFLLLNLISVIGALHALFNKNQ